MFLPSTKKSRGLMVPAPHSLSVAFLILQQCSSEHKYYASTVFLFVMNIDYNRIADADIPVAKDLFATKKAIPRTSTGVLATQ